MYGPKLCSRHGDTWSTDRPYGHPHRMHIHHRHTAYWHGERVVRSRTQQSEKFCAVNIEPRRDVPVQDVLRNGCVRLDNLLTRKSGACAAPYLRFQYRFCRGRTPHPREAGNPRALPRGPALAENHDLLDVCKMRT